MKSSFTIEFSDKEESVNFSTWLQSHFTQQINVTDLPDTDALYKTDKNFKKLLKEQKVAKQAVKDYIYKQKLKTKQ
jgi:hypothetical protein